MHQTLAEIQAKAARNAEHSKTQPPMESSAEMVARLQRESNVLRAQADSLVAEEFRGASVEGYEAQPGTRGGLDAAKAVIASGFTASKAFWGDDPGVGKTYLGHAIANAAIASGRAAIVANMARIVMAVGDAKRAWGSSELDVISRFARVPVLVMDDLGKELELAGGRSDVIAALRTLHLFVEERSLRKLPVVITTNRNFAELFALYETKAPPEFDVKYTMDRLRNLCPPKEWVQMTGRSMRGRD